MSPPRNFSPLNSLLKCLPCPWHALSGCYVPWHTLGPASTKNSPGLASAAKYSSSEVQLPWCLPTINLFLLLLMFVTPTWAELLDLLQNLNIAHSSSLRYSLSISAWVFCLSGIFKNSSFGTDKKKIHSRVFSGWRFFPSVSTFPLYKHLFHLLHISDLNSYFTVILRCWFQPSKLSAVDQLILVLFFFFSLTTLFLSSLTLGW